MLLTCRGFCQISGVLAEKEVPTSVPGDASNGSTPDSSKFGAFPASIVLRSEVVRRRKTSWSLPSCKCYPACFLMVTVGKLPSRRACSCGVRTPQEFFACSAPLGSVLAV